MQILLIVAGIALVVAFGYLAWLAEKKRREAMAALAARLGWSFDPSRDRDHDEQYAHFKIFRHGHGRGGAAGQAADETALLLGLKKLFAVVEAYPRLKADSSFLALQQELSNTEDRIAAARRFYNANIREMSQLCRTVPTNVIAGAFGFEGGEYFELGSEAERVVPRVDVSMTSDR